MKNVLVSHGIIFSVFEADLSGEFDNVKQHLGEVSGISTFPNLFVKGESIGGGTDLKQAEFSGEIYKKLGAFMGKSVVQTPRPRLTSAGLLWFPETVDGKVRSS